MQIILLTSYLILSGLISIKDIPASVEAAFRKHHPTVQVSLWEVCKEGYAASFNDEEGFKKAMYRADGTWLETRTRILLRDIPADVLREIRRVAGYTHMTYIGSVSTPEGRHYRIESETDREVIIRVFNENGVLKSEEIFLFSIQKA
jgi:hypothetical protein